MGGFERSGLEIHGLLEVGKSRQIIARFRWALMRFTYRNVTETSLIEYSLWTWPLFSDATEAINLLKPPSPPNGQNNNKITRRDHGKEIAAWRTLEQQHGWDVETGGASRDTWAAGSWKCRQNNSQDFVLGL
ncbi:hypothetical protein JTE90_002712 [Oedothorax gibbosus]|uniref:Uncharacterized protein n=1 Tax=Oedothorax gibbosus TaxID=931172 RepID=A0AAV6VY45_9ARAC|nr:hypothetical protein JTE90_002712 [Oedothorax gibbosus]